jgi:hypothetical protein
VLGMLLCIPHCLPYLCNWKNTQGKQWVTNKNGAPGGIRTPDQVVRSHLLYPAELRVRNYANCLLLTNPAYCLLTHYYLQLRVVISVLNIEACSLHHPILQHRQGHLSVR